MSGSAPKHACHDPFLFLTLVFLPSPEVAIYALPEARRPTRSGPTRSRDITAVRSHIYVVKQVINARNAPNV